MTTISPQVADAAPTTTPTETKPKPQREIFDVLDGVRVLLTFWVVGFHVLWHYAMFTDEATFSQLYFRETNDIIASGLNGVDYFFVLTGFLVAYPIFRGSRTGTWFEFVWLRVTRVYPMLLAAVAFFCLGISKLGANPYLTWDMHASQILRPLVDMEAGKESLGLPNNCHLSWTNLLFLNNFVPFGGCMGWTWSLCVQVHFFLIFPLVIKWFGTGKKLLWFCGVMTAVWMAMRTFIYISVILPVLKDTSKASMYIYSEEHIGQFFVMFNIWYSNSFQRMGCCFGGVILAYLQATKPQWLVNLHPNKVFTTIMTLLSAFILKKSMNVDFTDAFQTLFCSVGGLGHVFAIAVVFYMLINNIGPLSVITPFLKLKFWSHLAYPSYGVYLSHSFLIVWWYKQSWVHPTLFPVTTVSYLQNLAVVLALSYTFGYLATRFIEEPIKTFLRKYVDPVPQHVKQQQQHALQQQQDQQQTEAATTSPERKVEMIKINKKKD